MSIDEFFLCKIGSRITNDSPGLSEESLLEQGEKGWIEFSLGKITTCSENNNAVTN